MLLHLGPSFLFAILVFGIKALVSDGSSGCRTVGVVEGFGAKGFPILQFSRCSKPRLLLQDMFACVLFVQLPL